MKPVDVGELARGVLARDVSALGRAITLVESRHPGHAKLSAELLTQLVPHAGGAHRVGITGVPGAGKSTFIETLGLMLVEERENKVGVLAVDPTSTRTGGSILADKARMPRLASAEGAFIRPSPSAGTLGGVTRKTRETMVVLEAAGYDVILVETVGVGQSETMVADMVDFFLVLALAGAGDELQGIKKGVIELADMIAVNKADGDNVRRAQAAAAEYRHALAILTPASPNWRPPVVTVSAKEGTGLVELWSVIEAHRRQTSASGELEDKRRAQRRSWFSSLVEARVLETFWSRDDVAGRREELEQAVIDGRLSPSEAADRLLRG